MSMDFTGSCRHSAPHITPTPREPCRPAAPAAWCLPSRTTWSPRPWARLALTFSTEPSQLTRALQCTICLRLPQASSESPSAVGPKTPRSCRSAPWTAVLASSPLSIRKASPASTTTGIQNPLLLATFRCVHALTDCTERVAAESTGPAKSQTCPGGWRGWMVRAGLRRNVCICSLLSLGWLVTSRTVFSKGI